MARRRSRPRRQRVSLRDRRRTHLLEKARSFFVRAAVGAVVLGLLAGVLLQGDSLMGRFLARHTPAIEVKAPLILANLPVAAELPRRRIWLWLPGVGRSAKRALIRKYPPFRDVRFHKNFIDNKIVIQIEPRKPLIAWPDRGMDAEGVVFAIKPGDWKLPKALFAARGPRPELGRWLALLSRRADFWGTVAGVGEDRMGNVWFDLQTGTHVVWGKPDAPAPAERAETLSNVLADAHAHLGGSAMADLRFFDEGRIIVRPKTGVGK
jgi:hypothetical protein